MHTLTTITNFFKQIIADLPGFTRGFAVTATPAGAVVSPGTMPGAMVPAITGLPTLVTGIVGVPEYNHHTTQ